MVLERPGGPLSMCETAVPVPFSGQVLLRVRSCGVCRTDLHVLDGELPHPKRPIVLGHQVVGQVEAVGADVARLAVGDRVGVPWLSATCGRCQYCGSGQENLCDRARFTGYDIDGGYAEFAVANEGSCFRMRVRLRTEVAAFPLEQANEALAGLRAGRIRGSVVLTMGGTTPAQDST